MSKGISDLPDSEADLGNLSEDELSSNQQAVVVPVFAGEAKFALKWLCDPVAQFTRDAPAERPGKK